MDLNRYRFVSVWKLIFIFVCNLMLVDRALSRERLSRDNVVQKNQSPNNKVNRNTKTKKSTARVVAHHFNSSLLPVGQAEISLINGVRWGLGSEWQLGTSVVLDLMGRYNGSVKHKLFDFGFHETSFSFVGGYSNGSMGNRSGYGLGSQSGIVHSYFGWENSRINFGFFDHYLYMEWSSKENDPSVSEVGIIRGEVSGHLPVAFVGVDLIMAPSAYFSWITVVPVGGDLDILSDIGDSNVTYDILGEWANGAIAHLSYFGITVRFNQMYFEGGTILKGYQNEMTFYPYLNMFWRF